MSPGITEPRILEYEKRGKGVLKMAYYIYRNWVADKKAVIHRANCGHCNDGKGSHQNLLGDRNGKWFGPYPTLEEAQKEASQKYEGKQLELRKCGTCKP